MIRRARDPNKQETGLNASAGISYNKLLAKLASTTCKPNGQYVHHAGNGAGVRRKAARRLISAASDRRPA